MLHDSKLWLAPHDFWITQEIPDIFYAKNIITTINMMWLHSAEFLHMHLLPVRSIFYILLWVIFSRWPPGSSFILVAWGRVRVQLSAPEITASHLQKCLVCVWPGNVAFVWRGFCWLQWWQPQTPFSFTNTETMQCIPAKGLNLDQAEMWKSTTS